jgi:hypothetical protein
MKKGVYVKYNSLEHGKGAGQVIDVITEEDKTIILCEPVYTKRKDTKEYNNDIIIALDINDCKETNDINIPKGMRFR